MPNRPCRRAGPFRLSASSSARAAGARDEATGREGRPAEKGTLGVGIIVGEPTGICAKIYLSQDRALQIAAPRLRRSSSNGLQVHADCVRFRTRGSFKIAIRSRCPSTSGPVLRVIDYSGGDGRQQPRRARLARGHRPLVRLQERAARCVHRGRRTCSNTTSARATGRRCVQRWRRNAATTLFCDSRHAADRNRLKRVTPKARHAVVPARDDDGRALLQRRTQLRARSSRRAGSTCASPISRPRRLAPARRGRRDNWSFDNLVDFDLPAIINAAAAPTQNPRPLARRARRVRRARHRAHPARRARLILAATERVARRDAAPPCADQPRIARVTRAVGRAPVRALRAGTADESRGLHRTIDGLGRAPAGGRARRGIDYRAALANIDTPGPRVLRGCGLDVPARRRERDRTADRHLLATRGRDPAPTTSTSSRATRCATRSRSRFEAVTARVDPDRLERAAAATDASSTTRRSRCHR